MRSGVLCPLPLSILGYYPVLTCIGLVNIITITMNLQEEASLMSVEVIHSLIYGIAIDHWKGSDFNVSLTEQ